MARGPSPLLLDQIREPTCRLELISALKALKNDVVGNEQRKEIWIGLGILEPLARLLAAEDLSNRTGKQHHDPQAGIQPLGEEETIKLHAISILGSIAHGGPSFMTPIVLSSIIPTIFTYMCPTRNHPQVVLATLRTLRNMVDSSMLVPDTSGPNINVFAESFFSKQNISSLYKIISQSSAKHIIQGQISLSALLISRLCREERQQMWLAKYGVLDALAARLASVVVAGGCVVPGADVIARKEGLEADFPQPAPPSIDLPAILEAISTVVSSSKYRAWQLIYSPAILAVLPPTQFSEFEVNTSTRAAWNAYNASGLAARQSQLNAIDSLLPHMPLQHVKSATTHAFPPLGTSGSRDNLAQYAGTGLRKGSNTPKPAWAESSTAQTGGFLRDDTEREEIESPLVAWLFYLLRSKIGLERLMAANLLTVIHKAGLTNKSRETAFGLLVIPVLAQLLGDESLSDSSIPKDASTRAGDLSTLWTIEEVTPAVLALLITDSEYLQKAAHDAKFIPRLSKMIKIAYDPVTETSQGRLWSPIAHDDFVSKRLEINSVTTLGPLGIPPLLVHKLKVRESVLKSIAALAPLKDEYRKLFAEQGVVPYIVESLRPHPKKPKPKPAEDTGKESPTDEAEPAQAEYGTNPTSVLIAACGAVRALSRSTFLLRTTLVDDGVAMPIYRLLQHTDVEVQIDAAAAICNLVIDFSPMRETIAKAGVLKVLCEYAHSMNAKLRLNALWALKHLVLAASNNVKRTSLEELGSGWLVQLICDDTEDEALATSKMRWEAYDKAELDQDGDENMGMNYTDGRFDPKSVDNAGHMGRQVGGGGIDDDNTTSRYTTIRGQYNSHASARLAELRDAELNPARRARKDDVAVQEQGLDFIRNLIGGGHQDNGSSTSEMIEFLFDTLGQDRVFEILDSKLQHKIIKRRDRRSGSSSESRVIPASPEILAAVGWILVHMAASVPQHRQLIIAQTDMLRHLVPLFNHHSKDVRMSLCWLSANLTWMDDESDHTACAQRSHELKKLGFLSKLESLELDPELDIRERAKTAIWQMKQGY